MNYCPICKSKVDFYDWGVVLPRKKSRCPTCGCLERHRLMWIFLNDDRWLTDWDTMLHFAPESAIKEELSRLPLRKYVTADLIRGIGDVVVDIQNIDMPDASFDAVIASHILEHVADDDRAIKEVFRILTPNGWALFMVPQRGANTVENVDATEADRLILFGHKDHVRWYGEDFADKLKDAGFAVSVIQASDLVDSETKDLCRLNNDRIYFCRKGAAK